MFPYTRDPATGQLDVVLPCAAVFEADLPAGPAAVWPPFEQVRESTVRDDMCLVLEHVNSRGAVGRSEPRR